MTTDLKRNISDSLILLITSLNKKVFNPIELRKIIPYPASHIRVLMYLKHSGPVPISQVARDLDISKPNMTPIIDKLIIEDLVKRYNDPDDRRIIKIEVADKASELFEKHGAYIKDIISNKISFLSDEELSEFHALIQKMLSVVSKLN